MILSPNAARHKGRLAKTSRPAQPCAAHEANQETPAMLNPEITELTTAATDGAIAVVSVACMAILRRHRAASRRRVDLWSWVFGFLTAAAVFGAIAHGLDLTDAIRAWLWRPLFLSLGLVVALFVVGAVHDFQGERAGRSALVPMVAVGVAFFLVTQAISGAFLVFVLYEAVAMIAALGMYVVLAWQRRLPGAGVIATGIVLNIVAAAIQATGAVSFTFLVPFDHNGVFHLVQIVAIVVMTLGLQMGMGREDSTAT
jgi:predicted metal-binding protein